MTYKELLETYPVVKKLSIVQVIAYFGAWFSNVAIYTMLIDFEAGPIIISAVAAMHLLPAVVLAPLGGAVIDRFKLKPLMTTLLFTELIMTALFLLITSIDQVWFLMLILFIRMGAASMFFTSEMSLLPKLIDGEALQKANEIHSIIWSFTFTAGMALGGFVVNLYGIKTAFLIDMGFFIAAIIVFYRTDFNIAFVKSEETIRSLIVDGFYYIKLHPKIFHIILLHSSVGLTAYDTLIALLADHHYKYVIAVPLAIGLSNAVRSLALMVGPFLLTNFVNDVRLFYIFIFQGVAVIIWGLIQEDFYLGLIGMFLVGFTTTTIWSYTYAMLQNEVEKKYIGRVVAYNDMIFMVSNVLTTFFIGIMATKVDLGIITILLGIAFFIVAIYYQKIFLAWKFK